MSTSKKAKIGEANVDKDVQLLIQEANANAFGAENIGEMYDLGLV